MLNIYKFWFEKQPATALGLFRITFGLVMLLSLVSDWTDVSDFYSDSGFTPGDFVPAFYRDLRFSLLDYIQDPIAVQFLYAGFIIVMLLFTAGYKTKYMKFLQFLLVLSFQERNFLILNSGDTLLRVMSFYLMISPCGKALSIDALLQKTKEHISMWSVRLMQFQVAVVYFFAGIAKFGTEPWMDGTAVNFIVRNSLFNRFSMEWIVAIPLLVMLVTWASLAFELIFPFLIWFDRTRKILLVLGVFIHVSIFIFIDVGWFSLITLAAYPLFLKPQEIDTAKNWLAHNFKKFYKHSSFRFFNEVQDLFK